MTSRTRFSRTVLRGRRNSTAPVYPPGSPEIPDPPPDPPPLPPAHSRVLIAQRFNELQDHSHCTASDAVAKILSCVGLGRKFDKLRSRLRTRRATRKTKPTFESLEQDNLKRVARLARQGAIEVPPDISAIPGIRGPPTYQVVERVERQGKEWAGGDSVRERLIALGWDEEYCTRADEGRLPPRRWEGVGYHG